MVLTVALYPPYDWLSMHLGDRPKLAAATITVVILAIIIGDRLPGLASAWLMACKALRASSAPAP